jgi:hypothetical protein
VKAILATLALVAVLFAVAQQFQISQVDKQLAAAYAAQARLELENHALRQVASGKRTVTAIEAQSESWGAPFLRPLSGKAGAK